MDTSARKIPEERSETLLDGDGIDRFGRDLGAVRKDASYAAKAATVPGSGTGLVRNPSLSDSRTSLMQVTICLLGRKYSLSSPKQQMFLT